MTDSLFLFRYMPHGDYALISNKIYDYIVNNTKILEIESSRTDWAHWHSVDLAALTTSCPELLEYFDSVNLQIKYAVAIYTPVGVQGMIHRDGRTFTENDKMPLRCLWPIKNCKGSYTKFFNTGRAQLQDKVTPTGYWYREVVGPVTEIDAVELTSPVIFNPDVAHGVFTNPGCNEGRISFTIGFYNTNEEILNI
jgi:hypothetical protein